MVSAYPIGKERRKEKKFKWIFSILVEQGYKYI